MMSVHYIIKALASSANYIRAYHVIVYYNTATVHKHMNTIPGSFASPLNSCVIASSMSLCPNMEGAMLSITCGLVLAHQYHSLLILTCTICHMSTKCSTVPYMEEHSTPLPPPSSHHNTTYSNTSIISSHR